MNRFNDHLCFAVRFVGLGYVALWPVSTPADGDLFGASLLCEGSGAFGIVCGLPHPLHLGIGLHAAGVLCAVVAVLDLSVRAACCLRSRRKAAAIVPSRVDVASAPAATALPPRGRRPRMPPPRKDVEPRTHFGLRGVTR